MTVLENEFLKVAIRSQGAELTSIYNKATNTEHLWQGNPEIWGWHAPNLFPVVGESVHNQLNINGETYSIARHGFARNSEFQLVESDSINAKFSLRYNVTTLNVYPYKFDFQIIYDLFDNILRITYKVVNEDEQPIYFSLGAHPAFNVPFSKEEAYEDYFLEFENSENLERHNLSKAGFFDGTTEVIATNTTHIPLTKSLFDKDALVFKDLTSRKVCIKSKKHANRLEVYYPHFDYLGLWAKPGASFICIEPWLGCADRENKPTDIKDKEGIQFVEKGHVFEAAFTIGIH